MARVWLVWIVSWAVVVLILSALCVAQEFGLRNAAKVLGWHGAACLAAVAIGATILIIIGISYGGVLQ